MIKVLFERETEIGRCEYQPENSNPLPYAAPEYAILFAYTRATLNGSQGLLKIEQHCFLRHGADVPEQPWIRPEITIEPVLASPEEMAQMALASHENFIARARKKLPERLVA